MIRSLINCVCQFLFKHLKYLGSELQRELQFYVFMFHTQYIYKLSD